MTTLAMLPYDEEQARIAAREAHDDIEVRSYDTLAVFTMAVLMVTTCAVLCVVVLLLFVVFWK